MHYLCGTPPPEYSLVLKNGKKIVLMVSEMESNRMSREVKKGIWVINPAQLNIHPRSTCTQWMIELLKQENLEAVDVPSSFPAGMVESLRQQKINVEIIKTAVCPRREIKTPEEIKNIQRSQRAAVAAMKGAIDQISAAKIDPTGKLMEGKTELTSEKVRATIHHILLDHECMARETIVAGGPCSADPHERGAGVLRAAEPIVLDIFPRSGKTGYWGDITRTVCRGPAPAALKKQYNAVKAAQAAQLKAVKASVWADSIHQLGADLMAARGFKTETINNIPQGFIHGTGHGVGLEIHEAPRVSATNHQKLAAGHVITIEPGLYYSDVGGVRIEDTIVVTPDGYHMLAPCAKTLEI